MPTIKNPYKKAQAALEYILVLTVVAVVVFVALKPSTTSKSLLNRAQEASQGYYNSVTEVIMGKNPKPIDGGLCPAKPSGYRECACPAPAFGGKPCYGVSASMYCGDTACNNGETCQPNLPNTCYEDCGYCPNCADCGTKFITTGCEEPCPPVHPANCEVGKMCKVSDCPPGCPGYTSACVTDVACGCTPIPGQCTATAPAVCGVATAGKNSCDQPCTIPAVVCCGDGVQDGDETGIDCGGTGCGPCCTGVCIGTPVCNVATTGADQGCGQACTIPAAPCCQGSVSANGAPCPGTSQDSAQTWSHVTTCPALPSVCKATCNAGYVPTAGGASCTQCGNGTCAGGETCTTCPADCGACPGGWIVYNQGYVTATTGGGCTHACQSIGKVVGLDPSGNWCRCNGHPAPGGGNRERHFHYNTYEVYQCLAGSESGSGQDYSTYLNGCYCQ